MANWNGMPFGMAGRVGPRNHVLAGVQIALWEGEILGVDMRWSIVTNGKNAASAIPVVQPVPKLLWDFLLIFVL